MRRVLMLLTAATFVLASVGAVDAEARYWQQKSTAAKTDKKTPPKKKSDLKPFNEVKKGYDKEISGLFDFYINTDDNSVLMAVNKSQLDTIMLCSMTRSAGDGNYFDSGAQTGYFPFKLHRVGNNLQFLVVNLRVRADSVSNLARALERSISNSVFANTKVLSEPDTSGSFLIDPTELFIQDVPNVGYFLGQMAKTGFRFDKGNSYFGEIMSFPQNSEIDVVLHYSTNQPSSAAVLASPYSMMLRYHYSLSTIPESDYRPRVADERVGYFMTIHQDYTALDEEQPYVRYINRWHLKKKDPTAELSEPVEPIVYWIENTTPVELIPAVRAGIEFWNKAFEKAGFKNAIEVRVMPDTADWNPADVRFSTVRWFISPGAGYAVGPSRANPFTGQIYDADVRISADFIRSMFNFAERMIEPIAFGQPQNDLDLRNLGDELWNQLPPAHVCHYGHLSALHAAEAMAILDARTTLVDKPELTKKFVEQYLTDLVAHEVGHTLGLRHNFKASTAYTHEQRSDPNFTREHGVVSTVMEYTPPNLIPERMREADFYSVTPGPYDLWAIEYGYKEFNARSEREEQEQLQRIASRSAEPWLAYGTDEDCFGNSPRAIDPYTTQFDLGSDPLHYWGVRVGLSKELWSRIEERFEKPGENYKKLRNVFNYGWGSFSSGGANVARFIGGIEHSRSRVGDPGAGRPFKPVPAARQQAAMQFLVENIWNEDAFQFRPELLNKLQPERFPDFNWSVYNMMRLEYPVHAQVKAVQSTPMYYIYNPVTLARINDIELQYAVGEDVYTMTQIFQDVRRAVWREAIQRRNVTSMRRNLQRTHLDIIVELVTNYRLPVPDDAVTLARVDLRNLKGALEAALNAGGLDTISEGHYRDSLARIDAALNADMNYRM